MANQKLSTLTTIPAVDRAADLLYIVDNSGGTSNKVTPNVLLGISGDPVGTSDTQTLTNKTLTSPTVSGPTLSGTLTGTYTIGGTPTFPAAVVTLTGSQTLTNKTLTSPAINTPTIVNPTITTDTISEFTSAAGVTIDGVLLKDANMNGSYLTNSSVTASKLATGATNATVATSETTTSTSYADLTTTTDTVTVTIGANGLALVTIQSFMSNSTANAKCYVSVAVSGASTVAANDDTAVEFQAYGANAEGQLGDSFLLTGLSSGSTTFKLKYKVESGGGGAGTGTFKRRRVAVVPL